MKRDLFKIDSDEVKRILSLHEERSKNQYLGIISEIADEPMAGSNPIKSSGTKSPNKGGKNNGTYDKPYTDTDLQKWPVDWIVDTIDGYSNRGDLENIYRYLKAFKGKVAIVDTGAKLIKQAALPRIYYLYKVDEGIDLAEDIKNEKAIDNATQITKDKLINFIRSTKNEKISQVSTNKQPASDTNASSGGYTIQNPYTIANGAIKIQKGDVITKYGNGAQIKRGNTFITSFDCSTGKFNTRAGQVNVDGNKTILSDTIKSKFCKSSAVTTTTTTVAPSRKGTVGGVSRQSQTATVTKQIQTSLGSKTPTGKITEPELDAILTKLT